MNLDWGKVLREPVISLDGCALDNLELLLGGLYAPADGYCLPGAKPSAWPAAFFLEVSAAQARSAVRHGAALLADPDGTPLARMEIDDVEDTGEAMLHLAGSLEFLQPAEHSPARHLRLTTPLQLPTSPSRSLLAAAFAVPPSAAHLAETAAAVRAAEAELVLIASVTSSTAVRAISDLLQSLQSCAQWFENATVRLLIVPESTAAGARADPADGGPAHLRSTVLARIGADRVLDFTARQQDEADDGIHPGSTPGRGLVVFFTGLSGSGKSTVARELVECLQISEERATTLLDGDDMRRMLSAGLGFSREDRELNVRRIGWVASLVAKSGGIAVCAPIAPFAQTREEVRAMAEAVGDFLLVHVSTPLEICEARDRKGLYAKARAGLIPAFTGIDSAYEIPQDADCSIDTSTVSIEDGVAAVFHAITKLQSASASDASAEVRVNKLS